MVAPGSPGLTNPLSFLRRLRFKGKYRAGRARALLGRLAAELSGWMGWDVLAAIAEESQFEARWAPCRDLEVNFNQTLDLRLLTRESAALLRRIRCANALFTRRVYHFSLNDARHLELVRQRYALLQTSARDNVEFVCMYGFKTSLEEDVRRFRFLRALPGAYVFVQRYRPVVGSPAPDLSRLFDSRAETLMDELVRIVFPQNMKSMETYYRWLAEQYAAQRGRIHYPLVETLFRYNGRPRMAGFLDKLQQLAAGAAVPSGV
jgi:hypothetical protein